MKHIAIIVSLLAMLGASLLLPSPAHAQQTTSDATTPTIVGPAVVRMTGVQAAEANACTQLSPVPITPPADQVLAAEEIKIWGDNPLFLPFVSQGQTVSGPVCPVVSIGSDFLYTGQSLILQAAPGNIPVDAYLESLGVGTISYVPITNTLDFEKYASLMITGTLASATSNLKLQEVWKLESFGVQAAAPGQIPPDPSWWEFNLIRALDEHWASAFNFQLQTDDRVYRSPSDIGSLFGLLCPLQPTANAQYLGSMVVPRGATTEIWSLIRHQGCFAAAQYKWVNKLTMLSIMRRAEHRVVYNDVYAKSLVYAKAYNAEVYVSRSDGSLVQADDATLQALVLGGVVIVAIVLIAAGTQQYYLLVFVAA